MNRDMNNSTKKFVTLVFATALMVAGAFASFDKCFAQVEGVGLDKVVILKSGVYTLKEFSQEISAQTGLNVLSASYLKDRTVSVSFGSIKAKEALELVCDLCQLTVNLHDSKVGNTGKLFQTYEISRPVPGNIQKTEDIAKSIRQLIPRDILIYCNLDKMGSSDQMVRLTAQFSNRPDNLVRTDSMLEDLLTRCETLFKTHEELQFSSLSSNDKQTLSALHLFRKFAATSDVLFDHFGPHLLEPGSLEISLEMDKILKISGKDIMLSGETGPRQMTGFGKNITIRE